MIKLLTKTYLVTGLNQNLLFQKMLNAGVNAKKIKIIDEKRVEITIDEKDCLKYFAICKKTWYNKLVKVGGILAPFYRMVKNPLKAVAFLLSLCLIIASDFLYLKTDYKGDALTYRAKIESAFLSANLNRYSFITPKKLQAIKSQLQSYSNVGYLSVEKSGNEVVVDMRILKQEPQKPKTLKSDLIATENLKILNATVYSGTLLKFAGQEVLKGEVIAGAYDIVNEQQVKCELHAIITAECTFNYQYQAKFKPTKELLSRVYQTAVFLLGDYEILSHEIKTSKSNLINVCIKYEKIICGG